MNGTEYENIAQTLYTELINTTEKIPMSIEKFGKLYALLGLLLLLKKELSVINPLVYVGFKQLQSPTLINYNGGISNFYLL